MKPNCKIAPITRFAYGTGNLLGSGRGECSKRI